MKNKLVQSTFTVPYKDGREVICKPVTWAKLDDLTLLLEQIAREVIDKDGFIGDLLRPSNTKFWDAANSIAAMTPLVGADSKTLDLNQIDDVEDIVRIFITTEITRHESTGGIISGGDKGWIPGEIARINSVNFQNLLAKSLNLPQQ